jgi:hypothetical protein
MSIVGCLSLDVTMTIIMKRGHASDRCQILDGGLDLETIYLPPVIMQEKTTATASDFPTFRILDKGLDPETISFLRDMPRPMREGQTKKEESQ